jgi:hypothetical protein
MMELKSIPSHSPSVVTRKTGNEYILVPVTNNIADMDSVYTLNETGAFIWEQIDGKKNLGSIVELLTNEYNINTEIATNDLLDFINKMKEYLIIS